MSDPMTVRELAITFIDHMSDWIDGIPWVEGVVDEGDSFVAHFSDDTRFRVSVVQVGDGDE